MCYSAMVEADVRKIAHKFNALIDMDEFINLFVMREKNPAVKIPLGLEEHFLKNQTGTAEKAIANSILSFRSYDEAKRKQELADLEAEIKEIESRLKIKVTKSNQTKLEAKIRKRQKLMKSPYQGEHDTYRIYPFYFAPVIIFRSNQRYLVPMRYRILPENGVEIPSKYNVFNARRDSLQSARTWKHVFGRKHAIFPFIQFYEWVETKDQKKKEIVFKPDHFDRMWAASLYDEAPLGSWLHRSFAMVTDDPPPEVAEAGHDRCPVFLEEGLLNQWLLPNEKNLKELEALLDHKERTFYRHTLAA